MSDHAIADDSANMVSLPYLLRVTGYCRSSAYKAMHEGLLPEPVKVGRSSRWPKAEVTSVHDAMTRGDDKPALRALVLQLRKQRGGVQLSLISQ